MIVNKRPIQIYLADKQDQALRRLSKEQNATISELVRRAIDLLLAQVPVEADPAFKIIALGSSNVRNLAEDHDSYLTNEVEKESN